MTCRWVLDAGHRAEIRLLAVQPGLTPWGRRLPRGVPHPLWALVSPSVKQGVLGSLDLGVGTCWVLTGRLFYPPPRLFHASEHSEVLGRSPSFWSEDGEGAWEMRGPRAPRLGGHACHPGCRTCCCHAAGCHSDPALRPGAQLAARPRQEGVGVQGPLELLPRQVRGGDRGRGRTSGGICSRPAPQSCGPAHKWDTARPVSFPRLPPSDRDSPVAGAGRASQGQRWLSPPPVSPARGEASAVTSGYRVPINIASGAQPPR